MFWSCKLHKLGTPKVLRMDGRCGPIIRPPFAKVTQVKKQNMLNTINRFLMVLAGAKFAKVYSNAIFLFYF